MVNNLVSCKSLKYSVTELFMNKPDIGLALQIQIYSSKIISRMKNNY